MQEKIILHAFLVNTRIDERHLLQTRGKASTLCCDVYYSIPKLFTTNEILCPLNARFIICVYSISEIRQIDTKRKKNYTNKTLKLYYIIIICEHYLLFFVRRLFIYVFKVLFANVNFRYKMGSRIKLHINISL